MGDTNETNEITISNALLNLQEYGSESENDDVNIGDTTPNTTSARITVQPAPEEFGLVHTKSLKSKIERVKTRKRKRDQTRWQSEVRKKMRQSGKEYIDRKGNFHAAKQVQGSCNCSRKCNLLINEEQRNRIHADFWSKDDETKQHFYNKHVSKHRVHRRRKCDAPVKFQRYTHHYHLMDASKDNVLVRVCQQMFLQTLNISKDRIYYFSTKMNGHSTPNYLHGKNVSNITSDYVKSLIRLHILSFPTVESHYCRRDTARKYLNPSLNISKMYRLFLAMGHKIPGKDGMHRDVKISLSTYSKIFNTEFNLSFHRPKKDVCEKCLIYRNLVNPTDAEKSAFEDHVAKKEQSRAEHTKDLKDVIISKIYVLSIDLQNTFHAPKGPADSWYYKRKFNCHHLTAKCANNGKTYSSFWDESQSGRNGNDLASAALSILNQLFQDDPLIEHIILWSDSCVPQNRNKMMSMAILMFLKNNPSVKSVTQKYCEPGHSSIQDIDAVHAAIEHYLRAKQFYSPVSLIRLLQDMDQPKVKLELTVLQPGRDFYDFSNETCNYCFTVIPYTQVKALRYWSNCMDIDYNLSFEETGWKSASIIKKLRGKAVTSTLPEAIGLDLRKIKIPSEKVKDIRSMMSLMPEADVQFYNNLFPILAKPAKQ